MFELIKNPHTNPALDCISVAHTSENFKVVIYPNLGASLQECVKNDVQIIDGITNDEAGLVTYKQKYNSSWLFPFPNRIENGGYQFEGKEYQLETNETALNNSLHGFVFNKNFELVEEQLSDEQVSLKFNYSYDESIKGYPFPFDIQIAYHIQLDAIQMEVTCKNIGSNNMPFGLGWHPYFKSTNLAESILNFEGFSQYEVNDHMIPTREMKLTNKLPLKLENTFLDDCFMSKKAFTTFSTGKYDLAIEFEPSAAKNFIQCYTPATRDCIAIEPMTCAPNAFNNGDGLLILKPEEQYQWNIKMTL